MSRKLSVGLIAIMLAAALPVWAQDGGNATNPPVIIHIFRPLLSQEPAFPAKQAKTEETKATDLQVQPNLAVVGAKATTGLQAGLDAYQKGDFLVALKKLVPLADKGDATAQLYLGMMNEKGQGVPRNYKRAAVRYRQAAEQGNAEAQRHLGEMYNSGRGVPQNKKIAAEWYRKSSAQGGKEHAAKQANMEAKAKQEPEAKEAWVKTEAEFKKTEQARLETGVRTKEEAETKAIQISNKDGNAVTPVEPAPVAQSLDPTDGNTALVHIDHFDIKGNTLLNAGLIERLLAPYTGSARSYTDIQRALDVLEGAYRTAGYSAVNVITPEQEVTAGIVTFQVIESVIGKVTLNGNEHYDKANIRNALPTLAEGFTPSARELSENIRLANENPTRQLDVVLAVGEEANTVDAMVNVQDSSPHKMFLTLDNTGNQSTGMYRTGVGYQHNNLFNRDHAATFNYITSPNHVKDVTQVSASYRLPIYAVGDSIDLIAAYSDTNAGTTATVAGPLTFSGKGHVYSVHYNHYLPRQGEYTSKIIAGLDYRAYLNNCMILSTACPGIADVTVHPFSLTYNGTWTKPVYVADFSATLVRNIPGGKYGNDADFGASRASPTGGPGAKANYSILRLNGSLALPLPKDWQYRLALNAQYTQDALVSGESFGLVGATAVRGFLERELSSDKGYVLNTEIYTPDLASSLNIKNGNFRLLGFIDSAGGWNQLLAGETTSRTRAVSAGFGFRYAHGKNVSTKFDLAKVYGNGGGSTRGGDTRGHISLGVNW